MKAKEYLKLKGMADVGHYGLRTTDRSKEKMHQIMEDYADLVSREALMFGYKYGLQSDQKQFAPEKCRQAFLKRTTRQ